MKCAAFELLLNVQPYEKFNFGPRLFDTAMFRGDGEYSIRSSSSSSSGRMAVVWKCWC